MADREIALPFRLDGQGRIATTSDPARIGRQHLTSYIMTSPRERVMRPDFGTQLRDYAFENLDPLQFNLLSQRVQEKVVRDVRGIRMRGISASEGSEEASLTVTVEFALAVGAGDGVELSTTIPMGGTQ